MGGVGISEEAVFDLGNVDTLPDHLAPERGDGGDALGRHVRGSLCGAVRGVPRQCRRRKRSVAVLAPDHGAEQ